MKWGARCIIPTVCHNQFAAFQGELTSQEIPAIPRTLRSLHSHIRRVQQTIPFYFYRELQPQQCQLQPGPALNEELCRRQLAPEPGCVRKRGSGASASPSHQHEPTQPRHNSLVSKNTKFPPKLSFQPLICWQGVGFVMQVLQAVLSQAGKRMFPEERENLRCSCLPHAASRAHLSFKHSTGRCSADKAA